MAEYTPTIDVVFRKMTDGGVLLRTSTGAYFSVNEVGATVWEAIVAGPASDEDLLVAVRARFPDAPPEVEADIAAFVEELVARELVGQPHDATQDS